jgi:hypothetical protein
MDKLLKYMRYLLAHKYHVYTAGRALKVPLRQLIIHDWSKFLPNEFFPYAEHFYGVDRGEASRKSSASFRQAWLYHVHKNPHHWNHWVIINNEGKPFTYIIPEKYLREMVADWLGANMSIRGYYGYVEWLEANKNKIVMHPESRIALDELLKEADGWLKSLNH